MVPDVSSLVDTHLERMFATALLQAPDEHAKLRIGITDFADPQARDVYGAIANIRAAGAAVTDRKSVV